MDQKLKEKLAMHYKWIRLVYMIFFVVVSVIVKFIIWFIAAFQFITVLFTNYPNKILLGFGEHLSIYIAQIFRFLSYNTEVKPFPFNNWPDEHCVEYKGFKTAEEKLEKSASVNELKPGKRKRSK